MPEVVTSPDKKQRKLRNLIVNPQYQLRYIFWLSLSGVLLIVIYSCLVYYYVSENYALIVELAPITDEAKAQLYSELRGVVIRLSGLSLFFVGFTGILGLFFSHRTAGPLYHFNRIFKEIGGGNTQARVRLRPTDDFREVAASFNEMMDEIETKYIGSK